MSKYLPIYTINTHHTKMIGNTDYFMNWPNVADNSLRDQTCQSKAQHQTGTQAGVLWNQYTDPIEGKNLVKFMHERKTKYKDKKRYKCIIYTPRMCHRATRGMKNYAYRSSGNTHPLKSWQELTVDVTSPNKSNIYRCADLSHDTVKCPALNSNTRQHKTNTCIPKNVIPPSLA